MYEIGIAVSSGANGSGRDVVQRLTSKPVQNVTPGEATFWKELQVPIGKMAKQLCWHWIGRLDDPNNKRDFEQVQRLLEGAVHSVIDRVRPDANARIYVFFISDWEADEVRYGEGSLVDLISYFRLFRGWDESIMRLDNGNVQASPWTPLLIHLTTAE